MDSVRVKVLAGAVALLSSNAAVAAIYTNPASETPFNLMLDTGSYAWQNATSNLASYTTSYSGSYSVNGAPYVDTLRVDPLPGVEGSIDVYLMQPVSTYGYTSNYQNLDIDYSANLLDTGIVPESYLLTGQVSKDSGENLLSGGYSNIGFNMGLSLSFIDPYVANTANGLLTFRLGSAPGEWTYSFQTDFTTSSNYVSLGDYSPYLDMNSPIFFEAEYSINGDPGIAFSVDNLSLSVCGSVGEYTDYLISTNESEYLLDHVVIDALPVTSVPVPPAVWLFGTGLLGLIGIARRNRQ